MGICATTIAVGENCYRHPLDPVRASGVPAGAWILDDPLGIDRPERGFPLDPPFSEAERGLVAPPRTTAHRRSHAAIQGQALGVGISRQKKRGRVGHAAPSRWVNGGVSSREDAVRID